MEGVGGWEAVLENLTPIPVSPHDRNRPSLLQSSGPGVCGSSCAEP